MAEPRIAIGVDVGGSGIKAAVVDADDGRFVSERLRVVTPSPSTPDAVSASISRLVKRLVNATGIGPDVPLGRWGCQASCSVASSRRLRTSTRRGSSSRSHSAWAVVEATGHGHQRRGCSGDRRDALRDRSRQAGRGRAPDARDWRRIRRVHRRQARPEHRVRPDGDPRAARRAALRIRRADQARPVVESMDAGPRRAPDPDRRADLGPSCSSWAAGSTRISTSTARA